MDLNNIEVLLYRLQSGELFQVTRTHPEPQQVYDEDASERRFFRSSVDVVRGQLCHVLAKSFVDCVFC